MDQRALDLIENDEDDVLTPYYDSVGVLTAGRGHNLERPITQVQSDAYFKQDIADAESNLKNYRWYALLDTVRKAVVLNMMFNLGAPRFGGFKKMLAALGHADFITASAEMLDSKWAGQVGKRADRLHKMMLTGEWPQ